MLSDVVLTFLSSVVVLKPNNSLRFVPVLHSVPSYILTENDVSKFLSQRVLKEREADEIELSQAASHITSKFVLLPQTRHQ